MLNRVCICFALLFPIDAMAGAWTLAEGEGQAITTLAYSSAQDAFDENGQSVAIVPFEKFELRAYAEYGMTEWATLVGQAQIRTKEQGGDSANGLGRVDLGLRTRIWQNDFSVISVEGAVSAPGASDELAPLNGGDTDWELDARVLYGHGFSVGERHGFFDAQTGFRLRFDEPANEVRIDLTLGLDMTDRSFAMLQSFNRLSVGRARLPFEETQEHTLSLSSVYRATDTWSLQAGSKLTVHGRRVLRDQGFFLSVWRKF